MATYIITKEEKQELLKLAKLVYTNLSIEGKNRDNELLMILHKYHDDAIKKMKEDVISRKYMNMEIPFYLKKTLSMFISKVVDFEDLNRIYDEKKTPLKSLMYEYIQYEYPHLKLKHIQLLSKLFEDKNFKNTFITFATYGGTKETTITTLIDYIKNAPTNVHKNFAKIILLHMLTVTDDVELDVLEVYGFYDLLRFVKNLNFNENLVLLLYKDNLHLIVMQIWRLLSEGSIMYYMTDSIKNFITKNVEENVNNEEINFKTFIEMPYKEMIDRKKCLKDFIIKDIVINEMTDTPYSCYTNINTINIFQFNFASTYCPLKYTKVKNSWSWIYGLKYATLNDAKKNTLTKSKFILHVESKIQMISNYYYYKILAKNNFNPEIPTPFTKPSSKVFKIPNDFAYDKFLHTKTDSPTILPSDYQRFIFVSSFITNMIDRWDYTQKYFEKNIIFCIKNKKYTQFWSNIMEDYKNNPKLRWNGKRKTRNNTKIPKQTQFRKKVQNKKKNIKKNKFAFNFEIGPNNWGF